MAIFAYQKCQLGQGRGKNSVRILEVHEEQLERACPLNTGPSRYLMRSPPCLVVCVLVYTIAGCNNQNVPTKPNSPQSQTRVLVENSLSSSREPGARGGPSPRANLGIPRKYAHSPGGVGWGGIFSIANLVKSGFDRIRREIRAGDRADENDDCTSLLMDLDRTIGAIEEFSCTEKYSVDTTRGQVSNGFEDFSNVLPVIRVPRDRPVGGRAAAPVDASTSAVIKYRSTCAFHNEESALIKNFALMSALAAAGTDVTVIPIFLSPATVIESSDVSMRGLYLPGGVSRCVGSSIRFMVMEEFGESIREKIRREGTPFLKDIALQTAIEVIKRVKVLHLNGIVHGDITWANVLVRESTQGHFEVRLIDFDRSVFVNSAAPAASLPLKSGASPFKEHWSVGQLGDPDSVPNYYDDIYMIYELIGAMLRGDKQYSEMRDCGDVQSLIKWKETHDFINERSWLPKGEFHTAVHAQRQSGSAIPNHDNLIEILQGLLGK